MDVKYAFEDFDLFDYIAYDIYAIDNEKTGYDPACRYMTNNSIRIKYRAVAKEKWRNWLTDKIAANDTFKKLISSGDLNFFLYL